MNLLDFIGRFHPVMVHLPIGILIAAISLEILSHVKGFRKVRKSVKVLLVLGFAAAFVSSVTGLLHAQSGEFDESLITSHRALALVVTLFSLVAVLLYGKKSKEMRLGYFIIMFALTILIILTGHSGGSITHGVDYLKQSDEEKPVGMVIHPNALLYADLVAPVLKKKCTNCHGPSRQKGKLRLDQPEFILKGGEDGDVLSIGQGNAGEIWRRITLDREDDDHMPPKEKTPLSKDEISLITYWLETGTNFTATLSSLPHADSIIKVLQADNEAPPEKIHIDLDAPDKNLLDEFRAAGVTVSFLSQGDGRISLQFINADPKKLPDLLTKLPSMAEQLEEIKMPGTKLSHDQWGFLKSLAGLKRVHLENSSFSDAELQFLSGSHLEYLNLVGTSITALGLKQLSLNNLQQLYLFKTAVKPEDLKILQDHFSNSSIVLGNYQVLTLTTDTVVQKVKYVIPK